MAQVSDISIVLCGEAGQGINTVEHFLTHIFHRAGFHVFSTQELMSRIRGGSNSTEIRIGSRRVRAFVDRIDIFIPMSESAVGHVGNRVNENTLVLAEQSSPGSSQYPLAARAIASELGNPLFANIVAVGAIAGLCKINQEIVNRLIEKQFAAKSTDIIKKNILAAKRGYDTGIILAESKKFEVTPSPDARVGTEILLDGSEAVALGAIAGGCNFLAAYPMTPSSGVWTFLCQHEQAFSIITEQAEDEISAMTMGIGASYAGARAMVTTSGGGFDLMTEGLSLAAMQETPMVIHLAQRPGPATGLPTRTEQGDLELALYAGHGEFPRIIFAPGDLEQAFYLTQRAFNLAGRYQIPVFVLTDQFFIDSSYNLPPIDMLKATIEKPVVRTDNGYRRYLLTENGISPLGIPGYGDGFVNADCHVHDEEGHISESMDIRNKMVDKFHRKAKMLDSEIIAPQLVGPPDYHTLAICWGSNFNVVREALEILNDPGVSMLHFSQVYPLHPATGEFLKKAKNLVIVENNSTSQLGKLLKLQTSVEIKNRILKFNGLPFAVEEVVAGLKGL